MIRRSEREIIGSVTPAPYKIIDLETEDGATHKLFPFGESEPDEINARLVSHYLDEEKPVVRDVTLSRHKKITATREFIVDHKKEEAVVALSLGAIVIGSLFVRRLRKKNNS